MTGVHRGCSFVGLSASNRTSCAAGPVLLLRRGEDVPGGDVESGEQVERAVSNVVVRPRVMAKSRDTRVSSIA